MIALSAAMAVTAVLLLLPVGSATLVRHGTNIVANCTVGNNPAGEAYDPVNHHIYVNNAFAGTISVLKAPCTVIATISLPGNANNIAIAFNPQNNLVYSVDDYLNQVYVINGTSIQATLTGSGHATFSYPYAICYDPGDGIMLVANQGNTAYNSNITAIYGTSVIGDIGVGTQPDGIAYDPFYNVILVANYVSDNITMLSATFPFSGSVGSFGVGSGPTSIVFDPHDNYDYVTNANSANVSVVSGAGFVAGTINVGTTPTGLVWSQAKLSVYVMDYGSHDVKVLSGTSVTKTITLPKNAGPDFGTYDDVNNLVYISCGGLNKVYVLH